MPATTVGADQPLLGPSMSAYTTPGETQRDDGRAEVVGPAHGGVVARLGDVARARSSTAAAASGTLRKKMARHETASTSHPPTNGPTTTLTPLSPDHSPTARARSSATKHAEMIARLPGTSRAPPIPCSARAAISTSVFGAAPQMTDAAVNESKPEHEHAAAPEAVAERAAEDDQRAEGEQVRVGDPLQVAEAGVQVARDRRQRDVDHRGVEEGDAGAEHRGGDDPPARGARVAHPGGRRRARRRRRAWRRQSSRLQNQRRRRDAAGAASRSASSASAAGLGEVALAVGELALLAGEQPVLLRLGGGVLGAGGVQLHLQLLDHVLPGDELRLEALPLLGVDALLEGSLPAVEQAGDELARVERHRGEVAARPRARRRPPGSPARAPAAARRARRRRCPRRRRARPSSLGCERRRQRRHAVVLAGRPRRRSNGGGQVPRSVVDLDLDARPPRRPSRRPRPRWRSASSLVGGVGGAAPG